MPGTDRGRAYRRVGVGALLVAGSALVAGQLAVPRSHAPTLRQSAPSAGVPAEGPVPDTVARAVDDVAGSVTDLEPVVSIDGDHVTFQAHPNAAKYDEPAEQPGPAAPAEGFRLLSTSLTLGSGYTARLVQSSGIESLRQPLEAAVGAASQASGLPMSVLPGTVGTQAPGPGQIDVVVSSSSPCGGAWLACGGPVIDGSRIVAGRVWVSPRLLSRSSWEIWSTVHHELGHTLGLSHFDGIHAGRVQVMHSTRFDTAAYEAGDRNGLAAMARGVLAPTGSINGVAYRAGEVVAVGSVHDTAAGPAQVIATIDGRNAPTRRTGSNFLVVGGADGGPHRVCVSLRHAYGDVGLGCRDMVAPSNPFGSFDVVQSRSLGVYVSGWAIDPQTAKPISVLVKVGGVGLATKADSPRNDVGARYPGYGAMHGFATTRLTTPGTYRVCAIARNVGRGVDVTLGCRMVSVPLTSSSSRSGGLLNP